jgi:hypothetical protein
MWRVYWGGLPSGESSGIVASTLAFAYFITALIGLNRNQPPVQKAGNIDAPRTFRFEFPRAILMFWQEKVEQMRPIKIEA